MIWRNGIKTLYIFTLSNKRFLSLRIFVTKSLRSRKSCAQPIHYANTKNISSEHVPHQSLTEPSTHAETSSSSQFLGQSHRSKPITAPTIKHPRDNKTFPTRIAHLIYIYAWPRYNLRKDAVRRLDSQIRSDDLLILGQARYKFCSLSRAWNEIFSSPGDGSF